MEKKIFFGLILGSIFILGIVAALDFDPRGNIIGRGLHNITNFSRIIQDNYYITSVDTEGRSTDDAFTIYMNGTTGVFLPHFILQPGGDNQFSSISRSFGIINELESFLNNSNRTDCHAYFDAVGETLQIDCNTSTTGADLFVGDDFQVIGDIWVKDTDGDWHFLTRTLQELDRTFDDIVFNELEYNDSVSGGVYNYSFETEDGDTMVVNINTKETILTITNDTIALSNGTETVPKLNYITYQNENDPTLTISSTHPAAEHADVGRVLLGNVTGSDANVYAWINSFASNYEFIFSVSHRFFDMGALYDSGFTPTVTATDVSIQNGTMTQVLNEITTINNVSISSDRYYTVLSDGTFKMCDDLTCITEYTTGENIGNNKHFNIIWGLVPNASNTMRLIAVPQNKPATEWNTLAAAESDTSFLLYFPGNDLVKKTMIPVARTILRKGSDQNQVLSNGQRFFDIRGTLAGGGGNAPAPSITDHSALSSLDFVLSGHTGELNLPINWTYNQNYPAACPSGTWLPEIGDANVCTAPVADDIDPGDFPAGNYSFDTDLLFIDSTYDRVGIGTVNPLGKLHVYEGASGGTPNPSYDSLVLENSGNSGFTVLTPNNALGALIFADDDDNFVAAVRYNHTTDLMDFWVNNAAKMVIDSAGKVGIGTTNPSALLDVEGSLGNFRVSTNGATMDMTRDGINYLRMTGASASLRILTGGTAQENTRMTILSNGNIGIGTLGPNSGLQVSNGGAILGSKTLTGDFQNNVIFFSNAAGTLAQSGAYYNKLKILGGSSQSRDLQLWQENSGSAHIATSYGGNNLIIETFAHVVIDSDVNIGSGSVPATSAVLELESTTGALLLPRMTTAQQNALTAVEGMMIYNTNTGNIHAYVSDHAGGSWWRRLADQTP